MKCEDMKRISKRIKSMKKDGHWDKNQRLKYDRSNPKTMSTLMFPLHGENITCSYNFIPSFHVTEFKM